MLSVTMLLLFHALLPQLAVPCITSTTACPYGFNSNRIIAAIHLKSTLTQVLSNRFRHWNLLNNTA
jgi:hypothetical protein